MICVLGFIILSFLSIKIYLDINENYNISTESENMKQVLLDIVPIVASSQGTGLNLDADFLSISNILNPSSIHNHYYINQFKTRTQFNSFYDSNSTRITHLKLTYLEMDSNICSKIITKFEKNSDFISIGPFIAKNRLDDNITTYNMPDSFSNCQKASVNGTFQLTFYFKI